MSKKTAAPSSSSSSKATKPRKYFLHYFSNDFHRTTLTAVGDVEAAAREIRSVFKSRKFADKVVDTFRKISEDFDYEHLDASGSGRAIEVEGGGVCLAWFPVIPKDCTLAHELLHCVQFTCADLHVEDWEYEANLLDVMFEHFQKKFHEDSKVPFAPPSGVRKHEEEK